jgi:aspartyl-tRNA(Asn)/glutamyl-tRNA(Gln) amidotransferase subunit C
MEVNDALVRKLAHLSRLEFNTAENSEIKNDLQKMISFVDKLNELDLDGTEPLLHLSEEINVLREDEIKGSIRQSDGMKNAPEHDGAYFKVPKILKNPNG